MLEPYALDSCAMSTFDINPVIVADIDGLILSHPKVLEHHLEWCRIWFCRDSISTRKNVAVKVLAGPVELRTLESSGGTVPLGVADKAQLIFFLKIYNNFLSFWEKLHGIYNKLPVFVGKLVEESISKVFSIEGLKLKPLVLAVEVCSKEVFFPDLTEVFHECLGVGDSQCLDQLVLGILLSILISACSISKCLYKVKNQCFDHIPSILIKTIK